MAGHETTRTGISHAVTLLGQNPDQRAIWQADVDGVTGTAVEEVVRIASPVIWMRRTLTRDAELSGVQLHEGDKVAPLLRLGQPRRGRLRPIPTASTCAATRTPTSASVAPARTSASGAHLARREIALLIGELFRQIPDWQLAGEPEQLRSSFVNGIKHLPVDVGS